MNLRFQRCLVLVAMLPLLACGGEIGSTESLDTDESSLEQVQFGNRTFGVSNSGKAWSFSQSNGVARFEVRPGDYVVRPDYQDPKTVDRSELSEVKQTPNDQVFRIDWQFMLEPGPRTTSDWMCLGQVHTDLPTSPGFAVGMSADHLQMDIHESSGRLKVLWKDPNPIVRGRYYTLRAETYTHPTRGYQKVWLDGKLIVDYVGSIGIGNPSTNRLKVGIYRENAPETLVARYRNLSVRSGAPGTTFSDTAMPGDTGTGVPTTPPTTPPPTTPGLNIGNTPVSVQAQRFALRFDATVASSAANFLVGLSNGPATGYASLAATVRFNSQGLLDVRDGATYLADTAVPYVANKKYTFLMVVSIPEKRFSVFVTPEGESQKTLAWNKAFRTETALVTSLNNLAKIQHTVAGTVQVLP